MSRVIKSADAIKLLARHRETATSGPVPSEIDPAIAKRDVEIERLRHVLADRDDCIAALGEECANRYRAGLAEGETLGRKSADDGRRERLAVLESAARIALERQIRRLADVERLAPLLAIECLDRIFGDASDRAEQVHCIIRTQMARLAGQTVLEIELNPEDHAAIAPIWSGTGQLNDVLLVPADDLPSGGCRMRLAIGSLDAGLDQQWARLRAQLAELAAVEDVPA